MTCTTGSAILTPYGWIYRPGSCYNLSLQSSSVWQPSGGSLATYRKHSTINRVGRYLLAVGGYSPKTKRRMRSIEILDSGKPEGGWKETQQFSLPTGVSEHCSVILPGTNGRELYITGGRGRGDRVLKMSLSTGRWYSLNRMIFPRRLHACTKVTLNGRPGLAVSGGLSRGQNSSLTSVEFYDVTSGHWISLPDLTGGRHSHDMMVEEGRLRVLAGTSLVVEGPQAGQKYLRDMETFDGKRWVRDRRGLRTGRKGFSLVKIPAQRFRKMSVKSKRVPRRQ